MDQHTSPATEQQRHRATVYLHHMRAAFLGHGLDLDPHRLAVATVVVGLDDDFDVTTIEATGHVVTSQRIALIPPDTRHHLRTSGRMFFFYLDPLSVDCSRLDAGMMAHFNARADSIAAALCASANAETSAAEFIQAVSDLFELPKPPLADARLARTLGAIDADPVQFASIEQAAGFACMSVSRFQHVFKDATGTTFRRYRLWKRMAVVARCLSDGNDLTHAALEAGFSSSSHLSTSFREMFGIRPSDLVSLSIDLRL